jgi:hypothetical protein
MSSYRFLLCETEATVAYAISLGIAACGILTVAGTIAAGSALAWTMMGFVTFLIGAFSFFQLISHVNDG